MATQAVQFQAHNTRFMTQISHLQPTISIAQDTAPMAGTPQAMLLVQKSTKHTPLTPVIPSTQTGRQTLTQHTALNIMWWTPVVHIQARQQKPQQKPAPPPQVLRLQMWKIQALKWRMVLFIITERLAAAQWHQPQLKPMVPLWLNCIMNANNIKQHLIQMAVIELAIIKLTQLFKHTTTDIQKQFQNAHAQATP